MQTLPSTPVPLVSRPVLTSGAEPPGPHGQGWGLREKGSAKSREENTGHLRSHKEPGAARTLTPPHDRARPAFLCPLHKGSASTAPWLHQTPHRDPEKAEFCALYTGKNTEPQDGSWARKQQSRNPSAPS